jgi:hypothetical protein
MKPIKKAKTPGFMLSVFAFYRLIVPARGT